VPCHSLLARGHGEAGMTRLEHGRTLPCGRGVLRGVAQTLASLVSTRRSVLRMDRCEQHQQRGIEFCTERDVDALRMYLVRTRCTCACCRAAGTARTAWRGRCWTGRRPPGCRLPGTGGADPPACAAGNAGVWSALNEARALGAGRR
jgi:hypothetical protein